MLMIRTMVGPSRISGDGLYASEFIPAGTVVSKWVEGFDKTFPSDYPTTMPYAAKVAFITLASWDGHNWFISGDDGVYFNHADDPNVHVIPNRGPAATWDRIAARDIMPGEELTMNYADIGIDAI